MLEPIEFENLNEADVREEVIAPLLRRLGYRSGSLNNVIREQSLRYPKLSLGRKAPKKDPELRGKADYILEIDHRLRWVLEAKPPDPAISVDDVEQAWTYANHPEVRAIYFALCNGRTFAVYRTSDGPDVPPLLSVTYDRFDQDFQLMENLLGPGALLRDYPNIEIEVGIPIAPGLRSIARITNGIVRYDTNSLGSVPLNEIQTSIRGGAMERDERGRLVAFMTTVSLSRSLQELNERLGLSSFEIVSGDSQLSTDGRRPTVFVYEGRVTLPAGERFFDLTQWRHFKLERNMTFDITAKAAGTYRDRVFSGGFAMKMQYLEIGLPVTLSGSFELHLA